MLPENVRDEASHLVAAARQRLLQLVNGPVAPPSPRTVHKTAEKGTEMSSDRSFGRPYSGSRPVASEPALGSSSGSTWRSYTLALLYLVSLYLALLYLERNSDSSGVR